MDFQWILPVVYPVWISLFPIDTNCLKKLDLQSRGLVLLLLLGETKRIYFSWCRNISCYSGLGFRTPVNDENVYGDDENGRWQVAFFPARLALRFTHAPLNIKLLQLKNVPGFQTLVTCLASGAEKKLVSIDLCVFQYTRVLLHPKKLIRLFAHSSCHSGVAI